MNSQNDFLKPEIEFSEKLIAVLDLELQKLDDKDSILLLAVQIAYQARTGLAGCEVTIKINTSDNIELKSKHVHDLEPKWNPAFFEKFSIEEGWADEFKLLADCYDSKRKGNEPHWEECQWEENRKQVKRAWEIITAAIGEWKRSSNFEKLLPSCSHILITNGTGQGATATEALNGPMPDEFWEGSMFYPGE